MAAGFPLLTVSGKRIRRNGPGGAKVERPLLPDIIAVASDRLPADRPFLLLRAFLDVLPQRRVMYQDPRRWLLFRPSPFSIVQKRFHRVEFEPQARESRLIDGGANMNEAALPNDLHTIFVDRTRAFVNDGIIFRQRQPRWR